MDTETPLPDDPALRPWAISEDDHPGAHDPQALSRFLVGYAVLAPSGHNTQPWRFGVGGRSVELRADRSRALPVVDPDDRALVISCGAALLTLRVAAARFGHRTLVELLPDAHDDDLLARVTLEPGAGAGAEPSELFGAIIRRHTNRRPFDEREVPRAVVDQMTADARAEGAVLHVVDGAQREDVAALVAEGDRIQLSDPAFRRELAEWVHANRSDSADGMRGYGFGIGDLLSHAGPLVIRTFDTGRGQAAKDRELAEASPLLCVLTTAADRPRDWLAAGQALQRVLLRACTAGASSSYLNQPVEVPELRPRLAAAIGAADVPQLVLRFGYAPPARPEPRREAGQVVAASAGPSTGRGGG
jgi:hypothetical protein